MKVSITYRPEALLLRPREVAILIGLSERQVWTLIRNGQLQAVRPPGIRALRVAREDVEALVQSWRSYDSELTPSDGPS